MDATKAIPPRGDRKREAGCARGPTGAFRAGREGRATVNPTRGGLPAQKARVADSARAKNARRRAAAMASFDRSRTPTHRSTVRTSEQAEKRQDSGGWRPLGSRLGDGTWWLTARERRAFPAGQRRGR